MGLFTGMVIGLISIILFELPPFLEVFRDIRDELRKMNEREENRGK